ncbi:MAG: hypothetical protein ABII90_08370 [Bacteroidota bacterium]
MKSSENLFHLIKSLDQTEKSYFKKFASQHCNDEKPNYLKLYTAINKQKKFNEDEIIKQFSGQIWVKNFSREKNYLYNLILKSLRNYHAESSADMQIKGLLQDIEILYKKALYKQCAKLIAKAKKIAKNFEKQSLLLEIIKWEKLIYFSGKIADYLQNVINDEGQILKLINEKHQHHQLLSRFYDLTKNESLIRTRKDVELIKEIFKHPLVKGYEMPQSIEAKLLYYNIYSAFFHVIGEYRSGYYFCEKWIVLLESHPALINENPINYINALNYYLFTLDNNSEAFFSNLQKLKEIPEKFHRARNKRIEAAINTRYYNIFLALHNQTGNFKKSIALIPEIKKCLTLFRGKMNKYYELMLHLRIANAYFALKDYTNALYWLNPIMKDKGKDGRQDLYGFAMILNLIIYHEQSFDNYKMHDNFEKLIITTYSFFLKRNRIYDFEYRVINFFKEQIRNISTNKDLVKALIPLKKELSERLKAPFERKALEYFDFISWMESKIENKSMGEIIKGKFPIFSDRNYS